ncbi:hypothetical protein [Flavonifractor sp. An91]|uniref:hypothetical protein n=1 Tax=Flavonifractor sp. An91 TaxID=1965665 RepID=UPI0013A66099|nr:hypothetical protein [Flavonifractor sp. An91]
MLSLQSGCNIKTVQENLGHYAASFPLDTYGHVTDQMRQEGAKKEPISASSETKSRDDVK